MPHPLDDPILNAFASGAMVASILTVLYLLAARRNGPLLAYVPRRAVPWGAAVSILAVLPILLAFYSAGAAKEPRDPLSTLTLIAALAQQLIVVAAFMFVVAVMSGANRGDLGLPGSIGELKGNVLVGSVACLAALAPVHIEQILLMHMFYPHEETSGHPLIKMVTSGQPDIGVLVMTGVAAVIIAPICEEITFRLLLQGWLEKWEDRWLGWRVQEAPQSSDDLDVSTGDKAPLVGVETAEPGNSPFITGASPTSAEPPRRGVFGLPYGVFPIVVSALLFGLAHFGYGPEPVPIFMLGLVLGFVYQRTHRIVPSIVAHSLFNLFTMIVLWRMVFHAS